MATSRICSVPDCDKPHVARGYCSVHYSAWRRHGDPLVRTRPSPAQKGEPLSWLRSHVNHDDEACLYWPFSMFISGYGQVIVDGQGTNAHRVMCALAHGEPPTPDHVAAHNCKNGRKGCVNPNHLRWATPQENTHDRYSDGTMPFGASHPSAKLSDEALASILSLKGTMTQRQAAKLWGISKSHVGNIWRGDARREPPS